MTLNLPKKLSLDVGQESLEIKKPSTAKYVRPLPEGLHEVVITEVKPFTADRLDPTWQVLDIQFADVGGNYGYGRIRVPTAKLSYGDPSKPSSSIQIKILMSQFKALFGQDLDVSDGENLSKQLTKFFSTPAKLVGLQFKTKMMHTGAHFMYNKESKTYTVVGKDKKLLLPDEYPSIEAVESAAKVAQIKGIRKFPEPMYWELMDGHPNEKLIKEQFTSKKSQDILGF